MSAETPCPYCTKPGFDIYYDQTCRGCVDRMGKAPCPSCARLRADLAAAREELTRVIGAAQRFQPGGSPPPTDSAGLVFWICRTLADRAEAAEEKLARAREALAEPTLRDVREKLAAESRTVPLGATFHGGLLAGASVYNVMCWAIRRMDEALGAVPAPPAAEPKQLAAADMPEMTEAEKDARFVAAFRAEPPEEQDGEA